MLKALIYVLACLVLLVLAEKNVPTNYADIIKLYYTNGVWQCDLITCPEKTYGCKIFYKNSPQHHDVILRTNICYMENGATSLSNVQADNMTFDQNINFNITSYVDAVTVYSVGFGLLYNQNIDGAISPNDWSAVQHNMAETINIVNSRNISSYY